MTISRDRGNGLAALLLLPRPVQDDAHAVWLGFFKASKETLQIFFRFYQHFKKHYYLLFFVLNQGLLRT